MKEFAARLRSELENDILKYWIENSCDPRGGFLGRIDGRGNVVPGEPKGAILCARILWTFSQAYRLLGKKEYLEMATRAKREIIDRFYDPEFGGLYWSLDADGRPLDTKKQIYAIGFGIYGLSEFARATADAEALDYAARLFRDIEAHSYEPQFGGYLEAFARDWSPLADMRLSEKDRNDAKTMNTHLHVIEPYANLYRVWPDAELRKAIGGLLSTFRDRILRPDGHLGLFFTNEWDSTSEVISYGHDIEASWLLWEAAEVIGCEDDAWRELCLKIASAALEGFSDGLVYEKDLATGKTDTDRHWWVQAECVVGCTNAWQLSGERRYFDAAAAAWEYISMHIIDRRKGEWYWSAHADGTPNTSDDKAGFWKCPYHNGRMCMEIIRREAICSSSQGRR